MLTNYQRVKPPTIPSFRPHHSLEIQPQHIPIWLRQIVARFRKRMTRCQLLGGLFCEKLLLVLLLGTLQEISGDGIYW